MTKQYQVEEPIPTVLFNQAVKNLMRMRKAMGKPMTQEDATRMIAETILVDVEGDIQ